jgi:hypothetical protein
MAKMGNDETSIDEKLKSARRSHSVEAQEYDIRIASNGAWYYLGSPINRLDMVKLFAKILHRDEAGDYWLITPVERGRIIVDDAPFTAVELEIADGTGGRKPGGRKRDAVLTFRTNLDHRVDAGPDHPIRMAFNPETGEPRPYILVRPGLEALVVRPVYYQLVEHASVLKGRTGVWSHGVFFPLDQGA